MCGIFGVISQNIVNQRNLKRLVNHSMQRGTDSSGLIYFDKSRYHIHKADCRIDKLYEGISFPDTNIILGHSRLITNGLNDNQPVVRGNTCVIHNGIIVNEDEVWSKLKAERKLTVDSELILAIAEEYLSTGFEISNISTKILELCKGTISCALLLPEFGKLVLFSNNGSLYVGFDNNDIYFASERYGLELLDLKDINQIKGAPFIIDVFKSHQTFLIDEENTRKVNLIPEFIYNSSQRKLLKYEKHNLKRCSKCILPETMPFIYFNEKGVCNYCINHRPRNNPKPIEELFNLVGPYRRPGKELDCIVPFSGGRDSCYGLHLIVNELGMKPVTYTYDWGMVTDLGRRNISRMCAALGVENIIVAADIEKKRKNIRMNLEAWLKSPHLGMIAMLTAGDKHFFRYVEDIKRQTGINLNLWGVNPLEVTHFKTGFLGIEPDFEEKKVYSNGVLKQLRYHSKRFLAMTESVGYFNSSLWDTLSGEYHRSFTKKKDYFHLFDYWRWDENDVNSTLLNLYDWEMAVDTKSTWRIGDGTAAFYNYIYYTSVGFTEHDTFRSNQIREGQLMREDALRLVEIDNLPRYENIRWYLDVLGLDFEYVIKRVNAFALELGNFK